MSPIQILAVLSPVTHPIVDHHIQDSVRRTEVVVQTAEFLHLSYYLVMERERRCGEVEA